MHETSSESGSQLMSEDSTYLLIDALEIQLHELTLKNEELVQRVKLLEERIKTFQSVRDSKIITHVFSDLKNVSNGDFISCKTFVKAYFLSCKKP